MDLSFREKLHAIDAVVAGQGTAILSDVVVGRELANGTLVKAHPLTLPGYSFYAVWMHHSGDGILSQMDENRRLRMMGVRFPGELGRFTA